MKIACTFSYNLNDDIDNDISSGDITALQHSFVLPTLTFETSFVSSHSSTEEVERMPKKSNKTDKKKKKSASKKKTPNKPLKTKKKSKEGGVSAGAPPDEHERDVANNRAAIELIGRMIEAIDPAAIDAHTKERLMEVYELVAKAQKASLVKELAAGHSTAPASPAPAAGKSPPSPKGAGDGKEGKGGDSGGGKGGAEGAKVASPTPPAKEAAQSPPSPAKEAPKSGGEPAAKEAVKSK